MKQHHPLWAEFEEKTRGVPFAKDFQDSLRALACDPLESLGCRVLAWLKLKAWGNLCLYCVNDDGTPAYQADCALYLGVDKRGVSKACLYLEQRGYLKRDDKLLYPVISPVLSGPPPESSEKSQEWTSFLENWKVANASDFEELEVARATVERIRKVLRADYKKSRASATNFGANKERESENLEGVVSVGRYVDSEPTYPPTEPVPAASEPEPDPEPIPVWQQTVIEELEPAVGTECSPVKAEEIRENLGPATEEAFRKRLKERLPEYNGKKISWGLVSILAKDVGDLARKRPQRVMTAAAGETVVESESPPAEPVEVERNLCPKCGGMTIKYDSGEVARCRCQLRL